MPCAGRKAYPVQSADTVAIPGRAARQAPDETRGDRLRRWRNYSGVFDPIFGARPLKRAIQRKLRTRWQRKYSKATSAPRTLSRWIAEMECGVCEVLEKIGPEQRSPVVLARSWTTILTDPWRGVRSLQMECPACGSDKKEGRSRLARSSAGTVLCVLPVKPG